MTAFLIATQRHSHLQPEYALRDGKTRVGRHPDNDIGLMLESISRFHAEIVRQGEIYILQDCQSRNGTYLNGDRVTAASPIRQGDRIQFGNVEFIFRLSELAEPSAPSPSSDTNTNVIFASRESSHSVVHATPMADVARELAAEAEREGSQRVTILYQLLLFLRDNDIEDHGTIDNLLQQLLEVVKADRAALLTATGDERNMEPLAWKRRPATRRHTSPRIVISRTICDDAIKKRSAVLVANTKEDERLRTSESVAGEEINSAICVPLLAGERLLGLLYLDTQHPAEPLKKDDLAFVGTVAAEISFAMWQQQEGGGMSSEDALPRLRPDTLMHASRALERMLEHCTSSVPLVNAALAEGDLDGAKSSWKKVRAGLKRVSKVLGEMRQYAEPPKPTLSVVDVNKVIGDTIDAFKQELQTAGIEITTDLRDDLAPRRLDEEAIYRALINIVENAYEALVAQERGGNIRVRTYETPQGALIVEIADDGPGMDPELKARAFQPFNAGSDSHGIGMGLAMTRRLLEAVDGSVSLTSEKDRGTTVTMIFSPSSRA